MDDRACDALFMADANLSVRLSPECVADFSTVEQNSHDNKQTGRCGWTGIWQHDLKGRIALASVVAYCDHVLYGGRSYTMIDLRIVRIVAQN